MTGPSTAPPGSHRRILAVGDVALPLELDLEARGIAVVSSGGGHDAARRLRSDRNFDLVVVSGQLADMSAYDFVASMLRHMPGLRALVVGPGLNTDQSKALSGTGFVTFTPDVESAVRRLIGTKPAPARADDDGAFNPNLSEVFDRIVDEARITGPMAAANGPRSAPSTAPATAAVAQKAPIVQVNVDGLVQEKAGLVTELSSLRRTVDALSAERDGLRSSCDELKVRLSGKDEELAVASRAAERTVQERDAWRRDSESRRQHVEGMNAQMQNLALLRSELERENEELRGRVVDLEMSAEAAAEATRIQNDDGTYDASTAADATLLAEAQARIGQLQAALDGVNVRAGAMEDMLRDAQTAKGGVEDALRRTREEKAALEQSAANATTLQAEHDALSKEKSTLVSELDALRQANAASTTRIAELVEKLTAAAEQQSVTSQKLASATTEIDDVKLALSGARAELAALAETRESADTTSRELHDALESARAESERAFQDIAAVERERDAFEQELTTLRAQVSAHENDRGALQAALDESERQSAELAEKCRQLQTQLDATDAEKTRIDDERRAHATDAESEIRRWREQVAALETSADDRAAEHAARMADALERQRALAQELLREKESSAVKESSADESLRELQSAHDDVTADRARLTLEVAALRDEVDRVHADRATERLPENAPAAFKATMDALSGRMVQLQEEKIVVERLAEDLRDMLHAANAEVETMRRAALRQTTAVVTSSTVSTASRSEPSPPHATARLAPAAPAARKVPTPSLPGSEDDVTHPGLPLKLPPLTPPPTVPGIDGDDLLERAAAALIDVTDPLAARETRIAFEMPHVALAEKKRVAALDGLEGLDVDPDNSVAPDDAVVSDDAEPTRIGVSIPGMMSDDESFDVDLLSMEERTDPS